LNSERSYLRPPDDAEPRWPEGRAWPRLVVWGASQIVLYLALFQAYKMVRKTFITRAESVAFDNALDILRWQGNLHLNFELSWQRWVLDQGDLIKIFNNIYAYYMYGFYACAILLLVMSPPRYLYLRRVFIISMVLALPWYVIYPLAPPRFMQPYGWDPQLFQREWAGHRQPVCRDAEHALRMDDDRRDHGCRRAPMEMGWPSRRTVPDPAPALDRNRHRQPLLAGCGRRMGGNRTLVGDQPLAPLPAADPLAMATRSRRSRGSSELEPGMISAF
jgi:hypothetical protein